MKAWLACGSLGLLSCVAVLGARVSAQPQTLGGAMLTFHDQLRASRDALVFGDVQTFRAYVAALAGPEPPLGAFAESQRKHAKEIRSLAGKAGDIEDFGAATRVLGQITGECGGCHGGAGRGPEFPPAPEASEGEDSIGHMESYRWALERLWQGLTAADARAWAAGASKLQDVQILPDQLPPSARKPSVTRLAKEMRKVGVAAARAKPRRERARKLSEVVEVCGRCHAASGIKGT